MALRAGYKGFKTLGPGLEYDNTTGHLALKGEENPHSLENLSDVSITEPASEDVLIYDATEEEWINDDLSNTAALIAKVDKSDIAPVLSDAIAPEGGLDPDDQFYLNNVLYTATTTIPAGTAIVTSGAGQNCEVSDSVTGQIADRVTYADNGVLGAHNIDRTNYKSETVNGIVWTVLEDGGIKANGTVNDVNAPCNSDGFVADEDMYVIISNSGAYNNKCQTFLYDVIASHRGYKNSNGIIETENVYGGSELTYYMEKGHTYKIWLRIEGQNTQVNNYVFYPMMRILTDRNTAFRKKSETNRQLTVNKTDTSVIGTVEDGATASQAYAVGQGFIRNGQFRVAKGDGVSSGGQITDSNSEVKPIADCLNSSLQIIGVLTNSDDLNNVMRIGIYGIQTKPANCPDNANYSTLEVLNLSSTPGTGRQQRITKKDAIWVRAYTGNPVAWSNWYKYQGTEIIPNN